MTFPNNGTDRTSASPRHGRRWIIAAATAACCVLAAAAAAIIIGASDGDQAAAASDRTDCPTRITVTATTSQWGSLAQELGGPCVAVTSLLTSSTADPHDYEPTPADLTALSRADVVIVNGAGYDPWAQDAPFDGQRQTVISIADIAGVADTAAESHDEDGHDDEDAAGHDHGTVNPHLWFDPETVGAAAQAIGDAYLDRTGDDAESAGMIAASLDSWNDDYAAFVELIERGRRNGPLGYVATESIIGHLLDALGADDLTPQAYTNAMNSGAEPSASDLRSAIEATGGDDVDFLVANPQEMTPFAERLSQAASDSGKPVISVSEQLPGDQTTLLGWLTDITERILAIAS